MDIVFVHNEKTVWRQNDEFVEIDMEHTGFFDRIAQKFFKSPKISHILLDEYGTPLWLLLDGKNTVADIEESMEKSFPDEKEKMLNRVVQFLTTLEMNGFIKRNPCE